MSAMQGSTIPSNEARRLRRWNLAVGLIHAAQATILLLIADDVSLPVYASWIDGPPGAASLDLGEPLFELPFAPAVAAFLYLAAGDHLLVSFGRTRKWYERSLAQSINYARWIEYSVSASLMIALIAMLAGVWELNALIAIFAVNAAMILFGLLMERGSRPGPDADWLPFWLGTGVGMVPWAVIAIQLARGQSETGSVPGFVYGIFFSLLVLFALFAANMWLQYRQIGRWRDYLFGERSYIVLSLTAKSALAWQVYAGALAGSG
jgi:hypothetical protein